MQQLYWESERFHLCLPKEHRDDVQQGAGRQFAWLDAGSVKISLPRPAHQPPVGMLRDGYPVKIIRDGPQAVVGSYFIDEIEHTFYNFVQENTHEKNNPFIQKQDPSKQHFG